jgi:hypothetical protein
MSLRGASGVSDVAISIFLWRLRQVKIYRPRSDILILFILSLFISSCSANTPAVMLQVVTVYASSAVEPWLHELYDCAGTSAVLSRVADPASAEIALRVGEPSPLSSFAYQIDSEDVLIVTQRQSPIQNLTLEEAQALFAGQGDPAVQVWVYASGEDVQQVFDQYVMEGKGVASTARVAVNPQQMSDVLVNQTNTVGILPRHWKAGDSREVLVVATVPVLALTQNQPGGMIKELIGCLQK